MGERERESTSWWRNQRDIRQHLTTWLHISWECHTSTRTVYHSEREKERDMELREFCFGVVIRVTDHSTPINAWQGQQTLWHVVSDFIVVKLIASKFMQLFIISFKSVFIRAVLLSVSLSHERHHWHSAANDLHLFSYFLPSWYLGSI